MTRALLLGLSLVTLQGCGFTLRSASDPPPTKTAEIDDERNYITISKGVAMAITCFESEAGACKGLTLTPDDNTLVDVLPGYLLQRPNAYEPNATREPQDNVFVIVAKKAGSTDFTARSDTFTNLYRLVVTEH